MSESYKDLTQEKTAHVAKLYKELPEFMKGFGALSQGAICDGVLDKKTKELIALCIGVAKQCDACIGFHTQALVKLGAKKEEIYEALAVTVYMGGGPSLTYAANAVKAYEEFSS